MAQPRKHWLDWERGVAVVFMVEVHALDAWLAPAAAGGRLHDVLLMIGGFAAPSFLFMAGLSQQLADAALERRGVAAGERRRTALRRAGWLLGVAYLFRLAEYVLGGGFRVPNGWEGVLRVDVLNVIALALGASALLTVGLPRRAQLALPAAAALAVALLTPVVAGWTHSPSRILDYVYATWPRANFSLFNWSAFLFSGAVAGRVLVNGAGRERPFAFALAGAALFATGIAGDRLPPVYAFQDFWHTSPAWFAMRLGGVLALTGILQLVPPAADRVLAFLRTLGRHSLLGYVASIELTYGAATRLFHKSLSLETVVAGMVAMVAATWGLSASADAWTAWRARTATQPGTTSPAP